MGMGIARTRNNTQNKLFVCIAFAFTVLLGVNGLSVDVHSSRPLRKRDRIMKWLRGRFPIAPIPDPVTRADEEVYLPLSILVSTSSAIESPRSLSTTVLDIFSEFLGQSVLSSEITGRVAFSIGFLGAKVNHIHIETPIHYKYSCLIYILHRP